MDLDYVYSCEKYSVRVWHRTKCNKFINTKMALTVRLQNSSRQGAWRHVKVRGHNRHTTSKKGYAKMGGAGFKWMNITSLAPIGCHYYCETNWYVQTKAKYLWGPTYEHEPHCTWLDLQLGAANNTVRGKYWIKLPMRFALLGRV